MLQRRRNLIKSQLAKFNIRQVDVAQELGINKVSICNWIKGTFTSERINQYFGNRFGESFLKQIEIH